jgi:hypothetical protein
MDTRIVMVKVIHLDTFELNSRPPLYDAIIGFCVGTRSQRPLRRPLCNPD